MTAAAGAATVVIAGVLTALSVLGATGLLGPDAYSGQWPWRVFGLVTYMLFGALATAVFHQIGNGLPAE